jgi:hypothetical protein
VGQDGLGVLLVGRSGSGKSTTALACLRHGMEFVGDDYVLLLADPVPTAYSLYNSAKMHSAFLEEVLPAWKPWVAREIGPENKSVFYLHENLPQNLRASLELRAIVIPQISDQAQAALAPRPATEGLLALAPSTLFQFPEARREAMAFLSGLTRRLPVWVLRTGTDLASGPGALRRLLGTLEKHPREVGVG